MTEILIGIGRSLKFGASFRFSETFRLSTYLEVLEQTSGLPHAWDKLIIRAKVGFLDIHNMQRYKWSLLNHLRGTHLTPASSP